MGLYHYYEGGGYEDRIYQGQHTGAEHHPAGSLDGIPGVVGQCDLFC